MVADEGRWIATQGDRTVGGALGRRLLDATLEEARARGIRKV